MTDPLLFKNKSILITGGTGSFGRALARKLLNEDQCRKVIIFSRDEWKQWEMKGSEPIFSSSKIRYFLGDVRDGPRLERAFNDVNFVVHAAALKQVPAAEYNPSEFVKTNVNGAMNVIDAAINCGVEKVIGLSTDKAVNPVNLYGATKLCSDKIFVAGNAYVGARGFPCFSVVRYGNVVGSRGSIIPLWKRIADEGGSEILLTDPRMTRFWITLDQAVDFVIKSFCRMRGGEIFIPKIPSMKILDLAEAVAPGVSYKVCGIREGEKLHELMVSIDDARHTLDCEDHYVIVPEIYTDDPARLDRFLAGRKGRHLPDGFAYTSENNSEWLDVPRLREMLKTQD